MEFSERHKDDPEAVKAFARLEVNRMERGIPYLDLLPLLKKQARASNKRLYLDRDIHLTDFGHERVGQLIASWFETSVKR